MHVANIAMCSFCECASELLLQYRLLYVATLVNSIATEKHLLLFVHVQP